MMEQEVFWEKLRKIVREEIAFGLRTYSAVKKTEKAYTIAEFCARFQISKPTLYEWIKAGKITPIRIGRRVFFSKKDVEELLE